MSVKLLRCLETDLQEAKQALKNSIEFHKLFLVPEEDPEIYDQHFKLIQQLRQQKKNINASVEVSHQDGSTIFKPLWVNAVIEEIKIPYDSNYSEGSYKLDELLKIRK